MKATDKLLLHTCCAGCTIEYLDALGRQFPNNKLPEVILYFDNSNIHPRNEWVARLNAMKKASDTHGLELIVADWSPKRWFESIENDPDNTELRRCRGCWEMRLKGTVEKATDIGCGFFSTTLLVSQYQDREIIEEIGEEMSTRNIEFLRLNKKPAKKKTSGFYKQNYCGCVYSLVERYEEKFPE